MAQISPEDVRFLARTFGLEPFADEIEEIALRWHALVQAMAPLESVDLSSAEAIPKLSDEEV